MRRRMAVGGVLLAVALAGCTTDGQATRSPVSLDTGPFKVTRTSYDETSPQHRAGLALGEYMPLRTEVDPAIIYAMPGLGSWETRRLREFTEGAEELPENRAYRFGFTTEGNDWDGEESSHSISLSLLRYRDEAAAKAAVRPMLELWAKTIRTDRRDVDVDIAPLAGGPAGALVATSDGYGDDDVNAQVMMSNGRDVLRAYIAGYTEREVPALARRALDLLADASEESAAVDVSETDPEQDFRTLAVPFVKEPLNPLYEGAVVGPRTYAQKFHDSAPAYEIFAAADVDAVSERATSLFRAATPGQAKTLSEEFVSMWMTSDTARKAPSPRDLPQAACIEFTGEDSSAVCTVYYDRYAARSEEDTLELAQQAISAQYRMLTEFA